MKEELLHFMFDKKSLGHQFTTTENEKISIKNFGLLNRNAGPDFLDAQIQIDNVELFGHLEFHLSSSDWYKHGHHQDPAYDSVVAHFVRFHDQDVMVKHKALPTVELHDLITADLLRKSENRIKRSDWLCCESQFDKISEQTFKGQLETALHQRFKKKTDKVLSQIRANHGDLQKTWLQLIAPIFGGPVNALPMLELVSRIPISTFHRLGNVLEQEALLYGIAGFLDSENPDDYTRKLHSEFSFLKHKHSLNPMDIVNWKYSRMRPAGFPDIRIAQLGGFIRSGLSVGVIPKEINCSDYWMNHYRLGRIVKIKNFQISKDFHDLLTINARIPFRLALAQHLGEDAQPNSILSELKDIKTEDNEVVRAWKKKNVNVSSAYDSQALLEQRLGYCNEKKCLICSVGKELLVR